MHSLSVDYAQSPRLGALGEVHVAKVEGTSSWHGYIEDPWGKMLLRERRVQTRTEASRLSLRHTRVELSTLLLRWEFSTRSHQRAIKGVPSGSPAPASHFSFSLSLSFKVRQCHTWGRLPLTYVTLIIMCKFDTGVNHLSLGTYTARKPNKNTNSVKRKW